MLNRHLKRIIVLVSAVLGAPPQNVIQLANKGLALNTEARFAVFGHDLLSVAYSRIGKQSEAELHFSQARKFESQLKQ